MKKLILSLCAMFMLLSASAAKKSVKIMTFNVRCVVEADGLNQWKNRKDYAVNLLKFYKPDLFGVQEATHQQMVDILAGLSDYAYVGVGRSDGKTGGEYSAIFYEKVRFEVKDSGTFWLAEGEKTNIPGSLGWDADYPRIATWAIFKDKKTGKSFFYLNTHLDHIGVQARHNGAKLLLNFAKSHSKGLPVVMTGDFNAEPADDPILVLTQPEDKSFVLIDSKSVSKLVYGPEGTFHDFGRIEFEKRPRLDYIFINGKMSVKYHAVLTDNLGKLYPSDHHPVIAKIEFE